MRLIRALFSSVETAKTRCKTYDGIDVSRARFVELDLHERILHRSFFADELCGQSIAPNYGLMCHVVDVTINSVEALTNALTQQLVFDVTEADNIFFQVYFLRRHAVLVRQEIRPQQLLP